MGDDNAWVFDSLVGFLRGPVWNVPILTFIEHKSLIFEPGCEDDSEHTKIHEEYKNLVDFMLGSYMEDIGITPDQFESACGKASIKTTFHQTLFEQVWAADDYEIFKRMMIQKNLELQLQALELLQQRYGIIPESCMPGDAMSPEEQAVMEEVIKKSLEEHEAVQASLDEETRDLEKAIVESKFEKVRLEQERNREREMLEKALKMSLSDTPEEEEEEGEEEAEAPAEQETQQSDQIDPESIRRRAEYLKEQRDKLLALKQQEREKQLAAFEESAPQKRPKSSRAARKVLAGSDIDAHTLQVRKALAERLKAEVIGNQ
ncbi:cilia- and flagella-associated protein 36-like isoform X2 [Penaeus chinensis]|uniref:cilia- and flagella-associated protein 36-like isoform X2 n=1 Tax=Penaeus chinensis TaxID=139456 RepID=UPI001FB6B07C|nr:cilia- and flagella-associated protein 36-like isoform X2 [Penaeus chinensis]